MLKKVNVIYIIPIIYVLLITINSFQLFKTLSVITLPNYLMIYIPTVFIVFLLFRYFKQIVMKVIKRDKQSKIKFCSFLVYFSFLLIVLIIAWPGIWISDEYGILEKALVLYPHYWLHFLSYVYYGIGLILFMMPNGVVILQILLLALIFSNIFTTVYFRYNSRLKWLMIIPFFFPTILFYAINPVRIAPYAFICLFLFFNLLVYQKEDISKLTNAQIVTIALSYILLSTWRTEGIVFLLTLPIIIIVYYRKKINIKIIFMIVLSIASSFLINNFQKVNVQKLYHNSQYAYQTTAFINPLSMLTKIPNTFINDQEDWARIDHLIDSSLLKNQPYYLDIPSFFYQPEMLNNDATKEDYHIFLIGYTNLVTKHFPEFVAVRLKTLMAASNIGVEKINHIWANQLEFCSNPLTACSDIGKHQVTFNSINEKLRLSFLNFIFGVTGNLLIDTPILFIFWNVVVCVGLMVFIMLYAVYYRNLNWFLLSAVLLGYNTLIFITTPNAYLMYYFPLMLLSYIFTPLVFFDINKDKGNIFNLLKAIFKSKAKFFLVGWGFDLAGFLFLTSVTTQTNAITFFLSSLPSLFIIYSCVIREKFKNTVLFNQSIVFILIQSLFTLIMSLFMMFIYGKIQHSTFSQVLIIRQYSDLFLKLILMAITMVSSLVLSCFFMTKSSRFNIK